MEIWKDIEGYQGLYQISNYGNVKSLERKVYHPITKIQVINERILKKDLRRGYSCVTLSKNGKTKAFAIHRLVGIHFIEQIIGKNEINHINGVKTDNRVDNLEWSTSSENQIHAVKIGLQKSGENSVRSKLNYNQVLEIRKSKQSLKELADKFKVSISCISLIRRKKTYSQTK